MAQRADVPVGLLYSTSGPYAVLGREALDGALMALAEVNEDPAMPIRLVPEVADPGGDIERYHGAADRLVREAGCRHIVGGITSWSRKEMIPVIERHEALLWYVCPYEGYETNDRVIYTGACPNQHIVPLLSHVLPRYGRRAFLVGSNYIWGWEVNRIARERIGRRGGAVLGERYLPLGATDVDRIVGEIAEKKPDFVLNNLIGPSSYAFLKAYHALGQANPEFLATRRPVVSCNLTECELGEIGAAGEGHLSTAPYFHALKTPENEAFVATAARRLGAGRQLSAFFVGAYTAVRILAESVRQVATDDPQAVRAAATSRVHPGPLGQVAIDPATNHAVLRPHLGRIDAKGGIEVIESAPEAVAPDPYLVHDGEPVIPAQPGRERPHLRVVP